MEVSVQLHASAVLPPEKKLRGWVGSRTSLDVFGEESAILYKHKHKIRSFLQVNCVQNFWSENSRCKERNAEFPGLINIIADSWRIVTVLLIVFVSRVIACSRSSIQLLGQINLILPTGISDVI